MTFAESVTDPKGLLAEVLLHLGSWPAPSEVSDNEYRWMPKIGVEYFSILELHEEGKEITFTSFSTQFDYIKVILSSYNFAKLEKIKDFLQSTLPGRYR